MDIGLVSQASFVSQSGARGGDGGQSSATELAKPDSFGPAFKTDLSFDAMSPDPKSWLGLGSGERSEFGGIAEANPQDAEHARWARDKRHDYTEKVWALARSHFGLGEDTIIAVDAGGLAVMERLAAEHGLAAPEFPSSLKNTRFDNPFDDPDLRTSKVATFIVKSGDDHVDSRTPAKNEGAHFSLTIDIERGAEASCSHLVAVDGNTDLRRTIAKSPLSGALTSKLNAKDAVYAITSHRDIPTWHQGNPVAVVTAGGRGRRMDTAALDLFRKVQRYL